MASLSSASDPVMEAPRKPKDSSTPLIRATKRSGSSESRPVEDVQVPPAVVQLVPVAVQAKPHLESEDEEEDMRDRPLYSPSLSPDDLFAFPFPYVPPLSQEAIDKRLRASRSQIQSDAYQRLFRDLINPAGHVDYDDPDVPCGSCPCCQRMLSYVSSLRTVLDHMVSDIVQKSPAGTRIAPCALCLQEHREHVTHQDDAFVQDGDVQVQPRQSDSQREPERRTSRTEQDQVRRQSFQGDIQGRNIRNQPEDLRQGPTRRRSEGQRPKGSNGSNYTRPGQEEDPSSVPSQDGRAVHLSAVPQTSPSQDRQSGPGGRTEDASSKSTRDVHYTLSQENKRTQDSGRNDGRESTSSRDRPQGQNRELNQQGHQGFTSQVDQTANNQDFTNPHKPSLFVQPLVKESGPSGPDGSGPAPEEDRTWLQARAQLLEPPPFPPRDDRSPLVSHGDQYVFQQIDPDRPPNEAYVTIATDNLTALCCLVLGNSLLLSGTTRKLAVIVTDGVSGLLRHYLQSVFDVVQGVGVMDSQGSTKLALLERPELGVSFTKLYVWSLDQFTKCVFLESDTLVVQNCDELFEREELSAVPDIGWPDCFNSGVFVFAPSQDTIWKLIHFAEQQDSFDGGDQGLLNIFFQNWASDISRKLPFLYNLMANVSYTYKPAFRHFGSRVKIVHFFGSYKPWNVQFNPRTGQMAPGANVHPTYAQFVHFWLEIYTKRVLPIFSKEILDHMYSCEYACPHEVLQFIPSPARLQDSLPTPPSFRVYSGDIPRDQPSVVNSILQLGRESGESLDTNREQEVPQQPDPVEEQSDSQPVPEADKDPNAIPGSEFDDYQNMAAWEQGRMDYMGDAKSDTILKRLDFLIKGKR